MGVLTGELGAGFSGDPGGASSFTSSMTSDKNI